MGRTAVSENKAVPRALLKALVSLARRGGGGGGAWGGATGYFSLFWPAAVAGGRGEARVLSTLSLWYAALLLCLLLLGRGCEGKGESSGGTGGIEGWWGSSSALVLRRIASQSAPFALACFQGGSAWSFSWYRALIQISVATFLFVASLCCCLPRPALVAREKTMVQATLSCVGIGTATSAAAPKRRYSASAICGHRGGPAALGGSG
jgi:hypothetical protein